MLLFRDGYISFKVKINFIADEKNMDGWKYKQLGKKKLDFIFGKANFKIWFLSDIIKKYQVFCTEFTCTGRCYRYQVLCDISELSELGHQVKTNSILSQIKWDKTWIKKTFFKIEINGNQSEN
jgi:hypothetical protein